MALNFQFLGAKKKRNYFKPFVADSEVKSGKVFGIGFNKTGTTSLNQIMEDLGFNVAPQGEQERLLTQNVLNGNYADLRDFVFQFDFFQDLPFAQGFTFVACDALFPGSKFILTVRNEDAWYESIYNFHRKIFEFSDKTELTEGFFKNKNLYLADNYIYELKRRFVTTVKNYAALEDWKLLYNEAHYKDLYRAHNDAVIKYFKNRPEDLLVVDLTNETDTAKIVNFLGLPADSISNVPHENKT